MKKLIAVAVLLIVLIATGWMLYNHEKSKLSAWNRIKNPETVQMLKNFVAIKKAQAYASTNVLPPEIRAMFKYAERGDWRALSNSVQKVQSRYNDWYYLHFHNGYQVRQSAMENFIREVRKNYIYSKPPFRLYGIPRETVMEVYGAFDGFMTGDEKYSTKFGQDIIDSIPPGSIYFSGSDPGRIIVTALEKSQADADPFFTLAPLELAGGPYLDYLRSMYGGKIYIPTDADAQKCFQAEQDDLKQQEKNRQLHLDEDASAEKSFFPNSRQNFSMEINALLAKIVFDKNPNREFYLEENVPLEWMFPHLEPHGLIMKINRQPLAGLSDEVVRQDRDYWAKYMTPMIGGWLNENTTTEEVTAFAEKVFLRHELIDFKGDPLFVQNDYSCRTFSRLRSSLGELYAWRAYNTSDPAEKQRMNHAADLAYRQAFALCPYFELTIYRYVNFLAADNRFPDAILLAETAAKISSGFGLDAGTLQGMVNNLKEYKRQKTAEHDHSKPSQEDRLNDTISNLGQKVQREPTNATAIFFLASAYQQKKDFAKSLALWNEYVRLNPTNGMAYDNRGLVQLFAGNDDEAIRDFNEGIRLNPAEGKVFVYRGFAYSRKGDYVNAARDYTGALQIEANDDYYLACNGLAWLRATCPVTALRNGKEAVAMAIRACDLTNWADWQCLDTLAAAYAEDGDFTLAVKYETMALRKNTGDRKELEAHRSLYEKHQPFREEQIR